MEIFSVAVIDIIGTVGACLVLFGFYRISIGRWKSKSFWYEIDNFLGAILLMFYNVHHKSYISVVLNVIWAAVAFRGLTPFAERYERTIFKQKRRSRKK